MEWFLLEALVALLIAVVIVWWTMAARKKSLPDKREATGRDAE